MPKRKWLFGVAALALIAVVVSMRGLFSGDGAAANRGQAERTVPVDVAKAERKKVPVRLDALGTVTPIASVAIKARIDTTITAVHFQDGARVKEGDLLFTLDCRQVEADMKRNLGFIRREVAQA